MPGDEDRCRFGTASRTSQRKEFARVLRQAADTYLEVQVRAGRTSGRTNVGHMLASFDDVADFHVKLRCMRVARDEVIAMTDLQHVAELIMIFGGDHHACGRRNDGRTGRGRKIQTFMESIVSAERIQTPAEAR